jgi:hypothetical protein
MLVQFSDCGDGFLHQLAAECVEAFGPVELWVLAMDLRGKEGEGKVLL